MKTRGITLILSTVLAPLFSWPFDLLKDRIGGFLDLTPALGFARKNCNSENPRCGEITGNPDNSLEWTDLELILARTF
jgi:hypothetical protein